MISRLAQAVLFVLTAPAYILLPGALAEEPIQLQYSQSEIEDKWQVRIQSFLDKDVISLIDLLSFRPDSSS